MFVSVIFCSGSFSVALLYDSFRCLRWSFQGPGGLELVHGPRDSIRRLGVSATHDGCESPESILLAARSRLGRRAGVRDRARNFLVPTIPKE